ncbi:MAG: DUF4367 domain-containing protein [Oscillospiraceae bacterium]|jgi:hypothetical protein|nr:DUF4367 domain-containing protein [Oscillospiraceae bacterium]
MAYSKDLRDKILKQMLVAVVVLAVTFCMLMLCSADFREKIISFFEKRNGGYVSYTTTKLLNPEDFIKKDFELGYVPEGLELTSIQYHNNSTMLWYTLPNEYSGTGVISANSLSKYISVQFGVADDVPIDIDNEHCIIYKREYNGIEYTIHETDEPSMANIILFVKEDYYFILRAPFAMGIEELYETAKNTIAVPFTDKELY